MNNPTNSWEPIPTPNVLQDDKVPQEDHNFSISRQPNMATMISREWEDPYEMFSKVLE